MASTSLSRQLKRLESSSSAPLASKDASSVFGSKPFLLENADEKFLDEAKLENLAQNAAEKLGLDAKFGHVLFDEEELDAKMANEILAHLLSKLLTPPAQILLQWLIFRHDLHLHHRKALLLTTAPFFDFAIHQKVVAVLNAEDVFKTELGLVKRFTSDRGFFDDVCERVLDLKRLEGVNVDDFLHFFASMAVEALKSVRNVAEFQLRGLLKVAVVCLKADDVEFYALGSVIIAALLPKVEVKAKVARRLLKVMTKAKVTLSEGSLALLLIFCKSQRQTYDLETALKLLKGHEKVIEAAFKDKAFGTKVMLSLGLLIEDVVKAKLKVDEDNLKTLFKALFLGVASGVEVANDVKISLIVNTTKIYMKFKKAGRLVEEVKEALFGLRKAFPELYLRHSALKAGEDVDVNFIEGVENPESKHIACKKALMNEPVVLKAMKNRPLKPDDKKAVYGAVKAIFKKVEAAFVVNQVESRDLQNLTANFLTFCDKKVSASTALVDFICSEEAKKAFESDLEPLLVAKILLINEQEKDVLEVLKTQSSDSLIKKILKSRLPFKAKIEDFNEAAFKKIVALATQEDLEGVLSIDKTLLSPSVLTLALIVSSLKAEEDFKYVNLALKTLELIRETFSDLDVADEEEKTPLQSALRSRIVGKVPISALKFLGDAVKKANVEDKDDLSRRLLRLSCSWPSKKAKERLFEVHFGLVDDYEKFAADAILDPDFNDKMKTKTLKRLQSCDSNYALPRILVALKRPATSKAVFEILAKAKSKTYSTLLRHLVDNGEEIASNFDVNISRVMMRFDDLKTLSVLFGLCKDNVDLFNELAVFLEPLKTSKADLSAIADLGLKEPKAEKVVISTFMTSMLKDKKFEAFIFKAIEGQNAVEALKIISVEAADNEKFFKAALDLSSTDAKRDVLFEARNVLVNGLEKDFDLATKSLNALWPKKVNAEDSVKWKKVVFLLECCSGFKGRMTSTAFVKVCSSC